MIRFAVEFSGWSRCLLYRNHLPMYRTRKVVALPCFHRSLRNDQLCNFLVLIQGGIHWLGFDWLFHCSWHHSSDILYWHSSTKWGGRKQEPSSVRCCPLFAFCNSAPKPYWGEAVMTVAYLINRLPTWVLDKNAPIQLLTNSQTMFSIPPRVFGCACNVHNKSPTRGKLDPRAIGCVFVGYSPL